MNTRIRYNKENNKLNSKDNFTVNSKQYSVIIDLDKMEYVVHEKTDIQGSLYLLTGQAPTVNLLKIAAKQSLIDLGVRFKSESRLTKKDKETLNSTTEIVISE